MSLPKSKGFFITGTDTGVGKTTYAVKLLQEFNRRGLKTAALKPVASGCEKTNEGLRNDDALQLQQAASLKFVYHEINPYAFEPPIAPHIAARKINCELSAEKIYAQCQTVLNSAADCIIIEGAGGWLVPLNEKETMADLAKRFNFPVILVVSLRLGCLNHALLTWKEIKKSGLELAGWIANCLEPSMPALRENIDTLTTFFSMEEKSTIEFFEPTACRTLIR